MFIAPDHDFRSYLCICVEVQHYHIHLLLNTKPEVQFVHSLLLTFESHNHIGQKCDAIGYSQTLFSYHEVATLLINLLHFHVMGKQIASLVEAALNKSVKFVDQVNDEKKYIMSMVQATVTKTLNQVIRSLRTSPKSLLNPSSNKLRIMVVAD